MLDTVEAFPQVQIDSIDPSRMLTPIFGNHLRSVAALDTDSDIPAAELTFFRFTEKTPSGLHDPADFQQHHQHRGVEP